MNIVWATYDQMMQQELYSVYAKESFRSELKKVKTLPGTCVLAGAVLSDTRLCFWAKPGVLREDYIKLLENLFIDAGFVSEGFCQKILSFSMNCIQHTLSKTNSNVQPVLEELPVAVQFCELAMDDF